MPHEVGPHPLGEGGRVLGGQARQPLGQRVEGPVRVPGLRDAVGREEEPVTGAQPHRDDPGRGGLGEPQPERCPGLDLQFDDLPVPYQQRAALPARHDPHPPGVGGEVEQDRRREQLGVRLVRRVHREPAVEPGRHSLRVPLVQYRLPEGPQQ